MRAIFKSKINWSAIVLILIAVQPVIAAQEFKAITFKDGLLFTIGILIIIFRTYFTIPKTPKPKTNENIV